ncbi:MAG: GAF domain-containing protein, partial [Chloroflexi bacterium]|nr:GAF domain-containing protein [Chloroflexota bacterium]
MLEPSSNGAPGRQMHGVADLRALAQVILEIGRSLDLDDVLQASLRGILRVVGGDAGCFVLLRSDAPSVRLAHATNLPALLYEQLEQLEQLTLDPNLVPNAMSGGNRLQVISSIGHQLTEILKHRSISSFLLIPLNALADPVGVLLILTRGGKLLEPGSVDLLMSIGEQVGMAIENARLHADLKESEGWHRAFIENSPDGFWEGDFEGRIIYVNDAACRIVEMPREELMGKRVRDLVIDLGTASGMVQALQREGFLRDHVTAIRLKNRTLKTVSSTTRLVRNGAGKPVRYQSIFHDVTQSQQLLDKLSRRNQELNALNAIAAILSHPLELEQSFDQVCEQIVSITGMDSAALCLVDPSQTALCLVANRGVSEDLLNQVRRMGLDDPITRRIAVEGQVVAIDDVALYEEAGFAGPRAEGYHTGICMPVKKKGAVIGAVFVGSKSQTAYEQSDVDLLQNIGNQVGTALENAELYTQMQRRVEELDGLAQLSAACSASLDPAVLADIATSWTRRLLPSDLCTLRLIEADALSLRANSSTQPAELQEFVQFDRIFRDLAEKRVPYIVADVETDSALPASHKAAFRRVGMRSCLAVPLPVPDRVIGFLVSTRVGPHVWQPREVELLQTIGNQTANAIHNAMLFQSVLSEQRKVQALFDSGLSGLYATDADGRIVMFNRAAERISGWAFGEVMGREWKDVFADPAPLIAKALEQKETAYYPDGRRLTACDGRVIPS